MFSRRPGSRFNRGRIATAGGGAAAVVTPVTIMGGDALEWWRADLGVTVDVGVSNWVGQVLGTDFAQATDDAQPAHSADGGPNSTAMLSLDGTDDRLDCTLARAAPGTTPMVVWAVVRQVAWAANQTLFSDAAGTGIILQRTATPQLAASAGTLGANNSALAVGAWGRVQAYFDNTAAAALLCVATETTAAMGNTAGTAPIIGVNAAGTNFGQFDLCELAFFKAKPAGATLAALNDYVTGRYGTGLV